MLFFEGFARDQGPVHPRNEPPANQAPADNAGTECIETTNEDVSTIHKRQTLDARQLCVYDVADKLNKYGEYDIGGTYDGEHSDLWFYYTTSYNPTGKNFLNLFVCLRREGCYNIGISNSNEIHVPPGANSGRAYLLNQYKWQVFKSSQPNEKYFIKTFCLASKNLEARTLCIPILIKTDSISPFDMDLVKQIKLNHDFGDLLSKQEKNNFIVRSASGKEYPVHKIILAAHSPIIRNMIKEQETSNLCLDINDDNMKLLLEFLYTGTIKNLLKQDCLNLLDMAGKFQLNNLFFLVQFAIAEQINVTNCMDMAVIADKYKLEKLQTTTFEFIKTNPKVFETDGWKKLEDVNLTKKMFQYLHSNNK